MLDLISPNQPAELCLLDIEIEESERFLRIWQSQAELHQDTAFQEASLMIVGEYAAKLEILRGAREAARLHSRA